MQRHRRDQSGHDRRYQVAIAQGLDFLHRRQLPGGLWRFWTASHPGSPGIPPDTDDTACITHLLRRLGITVPDNRGCLLSNRDREGRFRTGTEPDTE